MKHAAWLLLALLSAAVNAAALDWNDPRRAVGTNDGIRIDAQLTTDFVSPHFPIGIEYQIRNLSLHAVGIVDRRCEASFDGDSRTIVLSVGSEIPVGGEMPALVIIAPGETKTLRAGAAFSGPVVPRFVRIVVNVLRDLAAFLPLREHQRLSDAQFDQWLETKDSIALNAIPVRYRDIPATPAADASKH
jgi:hypothetical protein